MTDAQVIAKKKILIITDSPELTTGLGRICREVTRRLLENYEVAVAGWHNKPSRHNFPFYIYPITKELSQESENQLRHVIADFNPDIVLCIGDIWDFVPASRVFSNCREINENFYAALWVAVDGEWTDLGWNEILKQFDSVFSMSKFGVPEINKLSNKFGNKYLYPGVDHNTFKNLDLKMDIKETQLDIQNTFTILNIGQNCDRKNIAATIDAFADFQKDKKDVFLFIATEPVSPNGQNLWAIITRNKLQRNVSVVKDVQPIGGVADSKINLLYNMCKVQVNSSIGEGLGLPIIEGMAAGCVPVALNYSSLPELVKDKRLSVDVAEFIYGAYGVVRGIISKKDIVNKLNVLYYDWKKYKDSEDQSQSIYFNLRNKCMKDSDKFTWESTVKYMSEEIELILHKNSVKQRSFIKNNVNIETLKLLMVIPSWGKNCGIAEYTKELSQSMEKSGTSVTIYPSNDLKELEKNLSKFNCVYIQHEYSFFQNRIDLETFLEKANELKVKTVILMHTFAPLYPYLNMVIDKASVVIFHNETVKNLAKKYRPDANNVYVMPMGCRPKFIKEDNALVKEALNIDKRFPVVGSFGFLRDQKGYNELVLAIKDMREKYPDILCMIAAPPHEFGSKAYDEAFFKFIEEEEMQNNVLIIRDYLEDEKLLKTLNACDLFVLNYKDSPIMGGNSAACKTLLRLCKPIITPNSIAFFDIKDAVLKVNNLNRALIVEYIEKVLNDKELYNKISLNAEAFIDRCEWSIVAKQHVKICRG